jgi:hypothetical protein
MMRVAHEEYFSGRNEELYPPGSVVGVFADETIPSDIFGRFFRFVSSDGRANA